MPVEPFSSADAARVVAHPDTPAAYVDWTELLPLTGAADRTHLGNLLAWSHRRARSPLGASRATFEQALLASDETVDRWMESLAATPVEDFLDHHIPFLRNVAGMRDATTADALVSTFLDAYERPVAESTRPPPAGRLARDFPDSVILEITRSCNFACTMCSSRTDGFRPETTMPLPVFGEMVGVLGPHARTLRVNGYGETSIVPGLSRYLDCLDEFGFAGIREIITNLSAPPEVYEDLFARGFVILVSWDATDPSTFERIRVGARYDEMIASLRRLGKVARAQPERLGLLVTVQEANATDIVLLVNLAAEVGAGLVIFNMVNEDDGSPWMEARFDELRARFEEAAGVGASRGIDVRVPDHLGPRRLRLRASRRSSATFCDRPWRELLVRWDTELTVCNMFNAFSYGLLRPPGRELDTGERLRRLWNGPNASLFRRAINGPHPHPYCRECYFLYP